MSRSLNTDIVETNTVTEVELTSFTMNAVDNKLEINYLLLKEDGSHFRRGRKVLDEPTQITAFFNIIGDAITNDGTNPKQALEDALYDKLINSL